ncbi:MAG: hypothetical protein HY329_00825, partial [Chloroflexi bacterium]|nr:hypothetical protein [Chloroflexota bacterium]
PAAMRYTEARLTQLAEELLADIDKNTVAFGPNFDDSLKEPLVLPSKIPNLLVNGSSGIAVGMATNIPPHNLTEVCNAITFLIDRYVGPVDAGVPFDLVWTRAFGQPVEVDRLQSYAGALSPALRKELQARATKPGARPTHESVAETLLDYVDDTVNVGPDDLLQFIKGPDFPTAGEILGVEGIKNAYSTGHGRVVMRAKAHIEEPRKDRFQIIVTELPYQVNKSSLIEKIAELVREKRIDGISELRDESDRQGMRIVMELKRDSQPRKILNQLYKHTAMQSAFSVNMLALVDGQPRVLTLKMVLQQYIAHRREIVTRRTEFDLEKARARAHILEGLKVALDHLDAVIRIIRGSRDTETARQDLIARFKLSEIQANAILDMQLRRLAALERQKILDELAEVKKVIAGLEALLSSPRRILGVIRDELAELIKKYGDERRTRIRVEEAGEFRDEDLIADQEVVVTVSTRGYVKRLPSDSYASQKRGGRGIKGVITREDDAVRHILIANTHDSILFFTKRGKVYQTKAHELPDVSRQARGLPLPNMINIDPSDTVTAVLPVREFREDHFFVMGTRGGEIKRVSVQEFDSVRSSGLIAMDLEPGDDLSCVRMSNGSSDLIVVSAAGQALRFPEKEVRVSARASGGMRSIKMGDGDHVVGMDVLSPGSQLAVFTQRGLGKRTAVDEYPTQHRAGQGVKTASVVDRSGRVVAATVLKPQDEVILISSGGLVIRTPADGIPKYGRPASGASVMRLRKNEEVVAVARVQAPDADGVADGDRSRPTRRRTRAAADGASEDGAKSDPSREPAKSKA